MSFDLFPADFFRGGIVMRCRLIALGCSLTGALGFLALPTAAARADSGVLARDTVLAAQARSAVLTKATLSLKAPAFVAYGSNVVISGRLTFAKGTPPAQTRITVTRTRAGTAAKTFIEHTGTTGSFAFTDQDPARGHYVYTAVFARDATAAAAKAAASVAVESPAPISISAPVTDNLYGALVRFTVTLGPTSADRTVTLYASPYGEARRFVATSKVNAQGKWYPTYPITRETTFTVVFAGDALDGPNSAHTTLNAYARVANRISGYFKTTKINGITYDVFHGSDTLTLYSTVTPNNHGQCLEPETEQFESGTTWDADTKYGCDTLDSASHDAAPFNLSAAVGELYRIRGDYIRSAKNLANLNQQGPWLYFDVVD
jgi:hypothetical protein